MDSNYLKISVEAMNAGGVEFAAGLAEQELREAEMQHGFRFPPDLRALLLYALPIGDRFPGYYGLDLPSYLFAEFDVPNPFPVPDSPKEIEFWSDLERLNG